MAFWAMPAPSQEQASSQGEAGAPLVAEVLGTPISTDDPEEMRYLILRGLVDRYAAEKGIEVSEPGMEVYVDSMRRRAERDREHREASRREIALKLKSESLPAGERETLSRRLAVLAELRDADDAERGGTAEDAAETASARRQVASAFIRQWKLNQALYRQYGGRIIFQQGGPEPLDAYRRFLEEQ
jgi:hypothetical protein